MGVYDACLRGCTSVLQVCRWEGSCTGDHGKGSSTIEGKENRRLHDVQIKQDIVPGSVRQAA